MEIKSEEEYEAALERIEQMFGRVDDEDDEIEFEALVKALAAWEEKMGFH